MKPGVAYSANLPCTQGAIKPCPYEAEGWEWVRRSYVGTLSCAQDGPRAVPSATRKITKRRFGNCRKWQGKGRLSSSSRLPSGESPHFRAGCLLLSHASFWQRRRWL